MTAKYFLIISRNPRNVSQYSEPVLSYGTQDWLFESRNSCNEHIHNSVSTWNTKSKICITKTLSFEKYLPLFLRIIRNIRRQVLLRKCKDFNVTAGWYHRAL